jgi:hypothetical protein
MNGHFSELGGIVPFVLATSLIFVAPRFGLFLILLSMGFGFFLLDTNISCYCVE